MFQGEKILVSPLDWGLGHAARIVPLVKKLNQNNEVKIACSQNQLNFLQNELPESEFFLLPSYEVKYSLHAPAWFTVLRQLGKLKKIWEAENSKLQNILNNFPAKIIISDNRYGIYASNCKNIFLSHQLKPIAPFLNNFFQKRYRKLLNPFDEIWCPDFAEPEKRLSGILGDAIGIDNVKYIGPLSRFTYKENETVKKYKRLFLLSGPEPARTALEQKLLDQFTNVNENNILVRGIKSLNKIAIRPGLEIQDELSAQELEKIIAESEIIYCRSGYSTLMDLHTLKRKAILIPTPGQTEQEYLAKYWKEKFDFEILNLKV